MDRRNLIGRLGALAAGYTFFRASGSAGVRSTSESPHAEAITLVIETQQKQIAQAEQSYFAEKGVDWWRGKPDQYHWHDTITRSWTVTRPVAPGIVDSTHWFMVAYSINGIVVCSWSVNTQKKTADLQKLKIEPLPK